MKWMSRSVISAAKVVECAAVLPPKRFAPPPTFSASPVGSFPREELPAELHSDLRHHGVGRQLAFGLGVAELEHRLVDGLMHEVDVTLCDLGGEGRRVRRGVAAEEVRAAADVLRIPRRVVPPRRATR